jgi:hypothetical protein
MTSSIFYQGFSRLLDFYGLKKSDKQIDIYYEKLKFCNDDLFNRLIEMAIEDGDQRGFPSIGKLKQKYREIEAMGGDQSKGAALELGCENCVRGWVQVKRYIPEYGHWEDRVAPCAFCNAGRIGRDPYMVQKSDVLYWACHPLPGGIWKGDIGSIARIEDEKRKPRFTSAELKEKYAARKAVAQ